MKSIYTKALVLNDKSWQVSLNCFLRTIFTIHCVNSLFWTLTAAVICLWRILYNSCGIIYRLYRKHERFFHFHLFFSIFLSISEWVASTYTHTHTLMEWSVLTVVRWSIDWCGIHFSVVSESVGVARVLTSHLCLF